MTRAGPDDDVAGLDDDLLIAELERRMTRLHNEDLGIRMPV
jgi:hypothetical protein